MTSTLPEDDWKRRLMAVVGDDESDRHRAWARVIIHPRCYERALRMAEPGSPHRGWTLLYRMMIREIESWCARNPDAAKAMVEAMDPDDMLGLYFKEKWGAMRWELHPSKAIHPDLREYLWTVDDQLEVMSHEMCEGCGALSRIRAPATTGDGLFGWVNSLCDRCRDASSRESVEYRERSWSERDTVRPFYEDAPPSSIEREVELELERALLDASEWGVLPAEEFRYAEDVLAEWDEAARKRRDAAYGETSFKPRVSARVAPPPCEEHHYTVSCGRWRYETAEVTVRAPDRERAAERAAARASRADWAPADRHGEPFVERVAGDGTDPDDEDDARIRLRIEELSGELAVLRRTLDERRGALLEAERERQIAARAAGPERTPTRSGVITLRIIATPPGDGDPPSDPVRADITGPVGSPEPTGE